MTKTMIAVVLFGIFISQAASAGKIQQACMKSDRKASAQTCRCIQDAANMSLSPKDQAMAAQFFVDPHRSQETRQSDNSATEKFWLRYKAFGELAQEFCG